MTWIDLCHKSIPKWNWNIWKALKYEVRGVIETSADCFFLSLRDNGWVWCYLDFSLYRCGAGDTWELRGGIPVVRQYKIDRNGASDRHSDHTSPNTWTMRRKNGEGWFGRGIARSPLSPRRLWLRRPDIDVAIDFFLPLTGKVGYRVGIDFFFGSFVAQHVSGCSGSDRRRSRTGCRWGGRGSVACRPVCAARWCGGRCFWHRYWRIDRWCRCCGYRRRRHAVWVE